MLRRTCHRVLQQTDNTLAWRVTVQKRMKLFIVFFVKLWGAMNRVSVIHLLVYARLIMAAVTPSDRLHDIAIPRSISQAFFETYLVAREACSRFLQVWVTSMQICAGLGMREQPSRAIRRR